MIRAALEADEQAALFDWAGWQAAKFPELRLLHAIPNGGYRNKAEAARLKAQGVKAGVPDICLPVARGGWHGLYIELKRDDGKSGASVEQKRWLDDLAGQGYVAMMCHGWANAASVVLAYLGGGRIWREPDKN